MPLALALAAPLIRGQRHGYARYLDRLQTIRAEVSLAGDDGQPYPHGVAQAVLLSLAAIRAADKTGTCSRVMAILAVLSAAGVRREVLHVAGRAGVLAGGGRRITADLVDQVLESLSDQSLLTFSLDGQTVMMHRLVAQVVRNGLARRERLGAVCWVAASVLEAHAIAVAGPQDRAAVRRIPQQVTALLDHTAELAEEPDEELGEILLRLRFISLYHLIELGDSAPQAIAVGEALTKDLVRALGTGHPDTLNARNSLAAAYLAADRVADAIPLFEQTLAAIVSQLGPDHPDTLTSQNNLASAYQDAGRVAEAIQLYELNLAERERVLGADQPGTLNSRGNLPRLSGGGPGRQGDPAARADLGQPRTSPGSRSPRYPDLTQEPGQGLPGHGPGRRGDPAARADPGRPATSPAPRSPPYPGRTESGTCRCRRESASGRRPEASCRSGPGRYFRPASGGLPPTRPRRRARTVSPARMPSARPFIPWPDAGCAAHRSRARPRGARGDRGRRPGGHRYGLRQVRGGPDGYCHWMLHDAAGAAESVQDTFVLAAATLGELPEPAKLRPWLFALARIAGAGSGPGQRPAMRPTRRTRRPAGTSGPMRPS